MSYQRKSDILLVSFFQYLGNGTLKTLSLKAKIISRSTHGKHTCSVFIHMHDFSYFNHRNKRSVMSEYRS